MADIEALSSAAYTPDFMLREAQSRSKDLKCAAVIGRNHDGSLLFMDSNNMSLDDLCVFQHMLQTIIQNRFNFKQDEDPFHG